MDSHLDGIVFRRKAERIPAHGMYDIVSLLQLVTAPYVRDHIASPVPYVKPVSGRIGEHVQAVILLLRIAGSIHLRIHRILFPFFLPFLFDCLMVVDNFLCHLKILPFIEILKGCRLSCPNCAPFHNSALKKSPFIFI